MNVTYFLERELIPKDGSKEMIRTFEENISKEDAELKIFPDIHYKKGARAVNGMMMVSAKNIYPACLGVENCGFTVGKLHSVDRETLVDSFRKYSEYVNENRQKHYSQEEVKELFFQYLEKDYQKKRDLYQFLGIQSVADLLERARVFLSRGILRRAVESLGNMGGGNHFFELHVVVDTTEPEKYKTGDIICILHSDSIAVGDYINLLYSNMSEWDYRKGLRAALERYAFRIKQLWWFMRHGVLWKSFRETCRLLYSQKDYRSISMHSVLGKDLLFAHNLASVFGDMNRDIIIGQWEQLSQLHIQDIFSHPHDNVTVEKWNGEYLTVQRNGVQNLGRDNYYALPGAMGTGVFLMKNTMNENTLFSANHGVGRMQDKHIAKKAYEEEKTKEDLQNREISLFRIGRGNIAEQNLKAFKDVEKVEQIMEKYDLGRMVAKTTPIAIIKG